VPENKELLKRISVDPNIYNGKPFVKGSNYSVSIILDLITSGMTNEEILEDCKNLEQEDIDACLLFTLHS